jgi:hypothetical protein
MPKINIKKPIILICIFLVGLFYVNQDILAYSNSTTHPALTREIIKYYNSYFNKSVSNDDVEVIVGGSIKEDEPVVRTLNHFYDPNNGKGLNVSNTGLASSIYGFLIPFSRSAKDWANDSFAQANFLGEFYANSALNPYARLTQNSIDIQTTYTWDKAIYKYIVGDKKSALESLGHVLHLLEDMAVPAHTRNDPHVSGDPYEVYVAQKFGNNINVSGLKSPFILPSLGDYFHSLATYSNNNFYSKETIGMQSGYKLPEWNYLNIENKGKYIFSISRDLFGDYILAKKPNNGSMFMSLKGGVDINDDVIRDSYWSHLSKQAVSYGAGLVDLFFKEIDRLKNDQAFLNNQKETFFGKIIGAIGDFLGINDSGNQNNNQMTPTPFITPIITPTPIPTVTPQINGAFLELGEEFQEFSGATPTPTITFSPIISMSPMMTPIPSSTPTSTIISTPTPSVTPTVYGGGYYAVSAGGTTITTSTPTPTPIPEESPTPTPEPTEEPSPTPTPTSTPTTTPTPSPTPTSTPTPQILISEFIYKAEGSDVGKEFIELYNAGQNDIDLDNWSLRLRIDDATSTDSLAIFGGNELDKTIINAKGFLLLGLNNYNSVNYDNKSADIIRSNVLGQKATTTYTILLLNDAEVIIDSITYLGNSVEDGQSLERKGSATSTIETMTHGVDQYIGNSFDGVGDLTDFIIRTNPQPQNFESLSEPRQQPPKIINLTGEIRNDTEMTLLFDLEEATTTDISFIVKSSATTTDIIESNWSSLMTVSTTDIILNSVDNKYELILLGVSTSSVDYFIIRTIDQDDWKSEISDVYQFPLPEIIIEPTPTPSPTPAFSENFEEYSIGNLNGQGGWTNTESVNYKFSVQSGTIYNGLQALSFDFLGAPEGYSIYEKSVDINGDGIFSFKLQAHSSQGPGGFWYNSATLTLVSKDYSSGDSWKIGYTFSLNCPSQTALISDYGDYLCLDGASIDAWHNFQIEFSQTNGIRARVNEGTWSEWKSGEHWGSYGGGINKIKIYGWGNTYREQKYYFDDLEFYAL